MCEDAATAITDLLSRAEAAEARAEKAERERNAAIRELDGVSSAVDDLDKFIDDHVHPSTPYDVYSSLRDNVDAISVWQYEAEWRNKKRGISVEECENCRYWNCDEYVMKRYGEGYGICELDGQVRFCSHKCEFCKNDVEEE